MRTLSSYFTRLPQWVFDWIVSVPSAGIQNRIVMRVLLEARQRLISQGDPLVHYTVGGVSIELPLSHNLPLIQRTYPQYDTNVARISQAVGTKYPNLTIIDIGANVGDSAARLREAKPFPVLCIEGDEKYYGILEQNSQKLGEGIVAVRALIGTSDGILAGSLRSEQGTARLVQTNTTDSVFVQRLSTLLELYPRFCTSKMIKIDTDGYDCSIIASESDLLNRMRPVIFFEYDPFFQNESEQIGFGVFDTLFETGYTHALVYDNSGDFLALTRLDDRTFLEDIHNYYSGREGRRYCDICVFHDEDVDICASIRDQELRFFAHHRSYQPL